MSEESFEKYWERCGELHASLCGADIKQFAKELFLSGEDHGKREVLTKLRALLEEAEKDNREKYPDESMMKFILERMREVIE